MKIGIVGSRTFPQLQIVEWFIRDLPYGVTIVSGGAKGVDACAAAMAQQYGLKVIEFFPNLSGCKQRHDFTKQYYARNQQIIDESDLIVAFTEKDNGGTWHTIKAARKQGKPVKIIRPCSFFDRGTDDIKSNYIVTKGQGPFHIKHVGLGSFALKLKRYLTTVEWADFINNKDTNAQELAQQMLPAFIVFFEKNNLFGTINAFTQAPKSIRHAKRTHPMDYICQSLSEYFNVPYVAMFKDWDKKTRGRFAQHPPLEITPQVSKYVGGVVFILDDVVTTGATLRACHQCLSALEIHCHAIAYLLYS